MKRGYKEINTFTFWNISITRPKPGYMPHLQAKFLGSQSVRQKIPHVMRKFLPFQADFRLIMRYAHTHADNFFMRMCASSRITTQSHENYYIAAFILDLRLHMSQSFNSQYEYLLRKPILSHMTIIFCMTKPMPHCPSESLV